MSTYIVNGIEVSGALLNEYYKENIGKIFKILGIYEECDMKQDFHPYITYLDNTLIELSGSYIILGNSAFLTLSSILTGMRDYENISHSQVKSLVFKCTNLIAKMVKDEG